MLLRVARSTSVLGRLRVNLTPAHASLSRRKVAANSYEPSKVESSFLFAESATLLMGTLITIFPGFLMGGLVPADAPKLALENGEIAARIAAALLFMLSTSMAALADASCKGNLTKSATYRRLNNGCFLLCTSSVVLALTAYATYDNMNNPLLLFALLLYLVPGSLAAFKGVAAQGLLQPSQLQSALQEDVAALSKQATSLASTKIGIFYQIEMLLAFVLGVVLLTFPATVIESPEPNFGAETLMRRLVGGEAVLLAVICSLLLDAAERGRLGASTFKALNLAAAAAVALTAFWLGDLVNISSGMIANSGDPASAEAVAQAALPVALLAGAPAAAFAYQGFTAKK